MSQELIHIEGKPPVIDFDFEGARAWLETELEKYDVALTEETVEQGKALATDLNKKAQALNRARIDKIKELSAPIKAVDDQAKELVQMMKDGRARLVRQVEQFEAHKSKEAERLLDELRTELREQLGVREEYHKAEFDDLVKPTALTPKGKLKKPAKDALEKRVREEEFIPQDRADKRLALLPAASHEAGLDAPLTKDHVRWFLHQPDGEYHSELQRVLDAELDRQEQARVRERERQKAREEAARKAEAAVPNRPARETPQEAEESPKPAAQEPEPTEKRNDAPPRTDAPPQWEDEDGKVSWVCTAEFTTSTDPAVTREAVEKELWRVMKKAGFTTLVRVTARPDDRPPF